MGDKGYDLFMKQQAAEALERRRNRGKVPPAPKSFGELLQQRTAMAAQLEEAKSTVAALEDHDVGLPPPPPPPSPKERKRSAPASKREREEEIPPPPPELLPHQITLKLRVGSTGKSKVYKSDGGALACEKFRQDQGLGTNLRQVITSSKGWSVFLNHLEKTKAEGLVDSQPLADLGCGLASMKIEGNSGGIKAAVAINCNPDKIRGKNQEQLAGISSSEERGFMRAGDIIWIRSSSPEDPQDAIVKDVLQLLGETLEGKFFLSPKGVFLMKEPVDPPALSLLKKIDNTRYNFSSESKFTPGKVGELTRLDRILEKAQGEYNAAFSHSLQSLQEAFTPMALKSYPKDRKDRVKISFSAFCGRRGMPLILLAQADESFAQWGKFELEFEEQRALRKRAGEVIPLGMDWPAMQGKHCTGTIVFQKNKFLSDKYSIDYDQPEPTADHQKEIAQTVAKAVPPRAEKVKKL